MSERLIRNSLISLGLILGSSNVSAVNPDVVNPLDLQKLEKLEKVLSEESFNVKKEVDLYTKGQYVFRPDSLNSKIKCVEGEQYVSFPIEVFDIKNKGIKVATFDVSYKIDELKEDEIDLVINHKGCFPSGLRQAKFSFDFYHRETATFENLYVAPKWSMTLSDLIDSNDSFCSKLYEESGNYSQYILETIQK